MSNFEQCEKWLVFKACELLQDVKILNFEHFRQTGHVETVCLLSNRKPDSYVHLNLKMEDYYRIKDAQKEQDKK